MCYITNELGMLNILSFLFAAFSAFSASVLSPQTYLNTTNHEDPTIVQCGSIDLKIGYQGYYNKEVDGAPNAGNWFFRDLTHEKFFNFSDIKPGDYGEGTVGLKVLNNDAWACVTISNLHNSENILTDPEMKAGDTTVGPDGGELAQYLNVTAWLDDGDNIWEYGEPLLFKNIYGPVSDVFNKKTYALADATTGFGPMKANVAKYIAFKWCAGTMTVNQTNYTIMCDGNGMGDMAQSDSVTADISFYAEASKNNSGFICRGIYNTPTPTPTKKPTPSPTPSLTPTGQAPTPTRKPTPTRIPFPTFFPFPSIRITPGCDINFPTMGCPGFR